MQPSEQPQHQNGHYQPQQNVPVETVQYGGRSNGVVNGESSDQQFCNNFDKNHSKRMLCTSVVDEQQVGRVKRHQPESEALNNPNNGKYQNPFLHNTYPFCHLLMIFFLHFSLR